MVRGSAPFTTVMSQSGQRKLYSPRLSLVQTRTRTSAVVSSTSPQVSQLARIVAMVWSDLVVTRVRTPSAWPRPKLRDFEPGFLTGSLDSVGCGFLIARGGERTENCHDGQL